MNNQCPVCKGGDYQKYCAGCNGSGTTPQETVNAIARLKVDGAKHNMTSRYLQKPDDSIKGLAPDGTEFELPEMLDYDDDVHPTPISEEKQESKFESKFERRLRIRYYAGWDDELKNDLEAFRQAEYQRGYTNGWKDCDENAPKRNKGKEL